MLAGPGAHRTKWLVERTAEIGHPILNAGRRAIDEPPFDDAVAFQSSQALGQRLLRETVHLTANGIEAKCSAGSADRAEYEDAPSIGDLIEQQAIEFMLSRFDGHKPVPLKIMYYPQSG